MCMGLGRLDLANSNTAWLIFSSASGLIAVFSVVSNWWLGSLEVGERGWIEDWENRLHQSRDSL